MPRLIVVLVLIATCAACSDPSAEGVPDRPPATPLTAVTESDGSGEPAASWHSVLDDYLLPTNLPAHAEGALVHAVNRSEGWPATEVDFADDYGDRFRLRMATEPVAAFAEELLAGPGVTPTPEQQQMATWGTLYLFDLMRLDETGTPSSRTTFLTNHHDVIHIVRYDAGTAAQATHRLDYVFEDRELVQRLESTRPGARQVWETVSVTDHLNDDMELDGVYYESFDGLYLKYLASGGESMHERIPLTRFDAPAQHGLAPGSEAPLHRETEGEAIVYTFPEPPGEDFEPTVSITSREADGPRGWETNIAARLWAQEARGLRIDDMAGLWAKRGTLLYLKLGQSMGPTRLAVYDAAEESAPPVVTVDEVVDLAFTRSGAYVLQAMPLGLGQSYAESPDCSHIDTQFTHQIVRVLALDGALTYPTGQLGCVAMQ